MSTVIDGKPATVERSRPVSVTGVPNPKIEAFTANNRITVRYDDGDCDQNVPAHRIRLPNEAKKSAALKFRGSRRAATCSPSC